MNSMVWYLLAHRHECINDFFSKFLATIAGARSSRNSNKKISGCVSLFELAKESHLYAVPVFSTSAQYGTNHSFKQHL